MHFRCSLCRREEKACWTMDLVSKMRALTSITVSGKNTCLNFKFKTKHTSYGCVLVWALGNRLQDGNTYAGSLLRGLLEPGTCRSQGGGLSRRWNVTQTWPVLWAVLGPPLCRDAADRIGTCPSAVTRPWMWGPSPLARQLPLSGGRPLRFSTRTLSR